MEEILYIATDYPPDPGARSLRNFHFLKELSLKNNVKIYCSNTVKNESLIQTFFKAPSNKKSLVNRLIAEILIGIELYFRLFFKYNCKIIFTTPPFFTLITLFTFLPKYKKRIIIDIRDQYPEVLVDLKVIKRESMGFRVLQFLLQRVLDKADLITCATNGLYKILLNYVKEDKLKTIYNGADQELFNYTQDKFEKFSIIFHGNLGRLYEISHINLLAKELGDRANIIVVGSGPMEPILDKSNIEYHASMDIESVSKIVKKCHLGIAPLASNDMTFKIFPVKVFEYLSCGMPVITYPFNESTEYLQKNKVGCALSALDMAKMKEYIIKCIEDKKYYDAQVEEAKSLGSKFTRKELSQLFADCVEKVENA